MVIGRRITKRKGQQLIALPPDVRERLGVIPGQWLYFHLGRKGEVVVSTSPARAGGKPPTAALEEELTRARARIADVERKRAGDVEAARGAAWMAVALKRLRVELKGLPVLDAINDRLRAIEAQLGIRRGEGRGGGVSRGRASQTGAGVVGWCGWRSCRRFLRGGGERESKLARRAPAVRRGGWRPAFRFHALCGTKSWGETGG